MNRTVAAGLVALLFVTAPLIARAQSYSLAESFGKDAQYFVRCDVKIAGSLKVIPVKIVDKVPVPDKDKTTMLNLTGKSTIAYDERILQVNSDRRVDRTVRAYKQLEFERKVGDQEQQSRLRPEAMRLVILRQNQYEVPFSPTTPLLWGEIELVRTDVFVPALVGLLPAQPVAVGASWNAERSAIQELTELDKIDDAEFTCKFEQVTKLGDRPNALIRFKGNVKGIGEDGHAHHILEGVCYVDLQARFMSYIYVSATHRMLDKDKNEIGKISGTLTITRGAAQTRDVGDDALRGLTLEPNAENTMLLFEHPQIGARFVYPRNWRVGVLNDKQIAVDERRGSGFLITLLPAASTPKGAQFHKDTRDWLSKQDAKILRDDAPRALQGDLEGFSFDAELGKNKERVLLQYYTLRQNTLGATIAARYTQTDLQAVYREGERIIRGLQLRGK